MHPFELEIAPHLRGWNTFMYGQKRNLRRYPDLRLEPLDSRELVGFVVKRRKDSYFDGLAKGGVTRSVRVANRTVKHTSRARAHLHRIVLLVHDDFVGGHAGKVTPALRGAVYQAVAISARRWLAARKELGEDHFVRTNGSHVAQCERHVLDAAVLPAASPEVVDLEMPAVRRSSE